MKEKLVLPMLLCRVVRTQSPLNQKLQDMLNGRFRQLAGLLLTAPNAQQSQSTVQRAQPQAPASAQPQPLPTQAAQPGAESALELARRRHDELGAPSPHALPVAPAL